MNLPVSGSELVILRCTSNSLQFKILYYFFKIRSHFEKLVQNFELKRIGGAPKGHQLTPLRKSIQVRPLHQAYATCTVNSDPYLVLIKFTRKAFACLLAMQSLCLLHCFSCLQAMLPQIVISYCSQLVYFLVSSALDFLIVLMNSE